MRSADRLLENLISKQPSNLSFNNVDEWFSWFNIHSNEYDAAVDCAISCGFHLSSVGYSFVSGYQLAISQLLQQKSNKMRAVCATEGKPPFHPRKIQTFLTETNGQWVLNGSKSFVTLGDKAQQLLVLARLYNPQDNDKYKFKLVVVNSDAEGVKLTALPTLPFVPEIPHAAVSFYQTVVKQEDILPGDGYSDYVKLFRTVEDCIVFATLLGYFLKQVRLHPNWPNELLEELLTLIITLRAIAARDPGSEITHIALSTVLLQSSELFKKIEKVWALENEESYQLWTRDSRIAQVAFSAREMRLKKARELLSKI